MATAQTARPNTMSAAVARPTAAPGVQVVAPEPARIPQLYLGGIDSFGAGGNGRRADLVRFPALPKRANSAAPSPLIRKNYRALARRR